MSDPGYQDLIRSILRKLRGKRSQSQLSTQLGLVHNHVYKWESGERKIQWSDFVKILEQKRIDLKPLFFDLFSYQGDIRDFSKLCDHILMPRTNDTIARLLSVSKYRVNGWRSGKGKFYLVDMLTILDQFSKYLIDFVIQFLNLDEIKALGYSSIEYETRELELKNPILSLYLRIIETSGHEEFKGDTISYISKLLPCDERVLRNLLDQAVDVGCLKKVKDKYFSNSLHIDMRGKKAIDGRKFWIQKALEVLSQEKIKPPDYSFGNLVYCISQSGQNKILDEYYSFFSSVREIIENDSGDEGAYILNTQFFRVIG